MLDTLIASERESLLNRTEKNTDQNGILKAGSVNDYKEVGFGRTKRDNDLAVAETNLKSDPSFKSSLAHETPEQHRNLEGEFITSQWLTRQSIESAPSIDPLKMHKDGRPPFGFRTGLPRYSARWGTKSGAKKSFVWKYFFHPELTMGVRDLTHTQCMLCDSQLAFNTSGTTTTMLNHLKSRHSEVVEREQQHQLMLNMEDRRLTPKGPTHPPNIQSVRQERTRPTQCDPVLGHSLMKNGLLKRTQRGRPPGSGRKACPSSKMFATHGGYRSGLGRFDALNPRFYGSSQSSVAGNKYLSQCAPGMHGRFSRGHKTQVQPLLPQITDLLPEQDGFKLRGPLGQENSLLHPLISPVPGRNVPQIPRPTDLFNMSLWMAMHNNRSMKTTNLPLMAPTTDTSRNGWNKFFASMIGLNGHCHDFINGGSLATVSQSVFDNHSTSLPLDLKVGCMGADNGDAAVRRSSLPQNNTNLSNNYTDIKHNSVFKSPYTSRTTERELPPPTYYSLESLSGLQRSQRQNDISLELMKKKNVLSLFKAMTHPLAGRLFNGVDIEPCKEASRPQEMRNFVNAPWNRQRSEICPCRLEGNKRSVIDVYAATIENDRKVETSQPLDLSCPSRSKQYTITSLDSIPDHLTASRSFRHQNQEADNGNLLLKFDEELHYRDQKRGSFPTETELLSKSFTPSRMRGFPADEMSQASIPSSQMTAGNWTFTSKRKCSKPSHISSRTEMPFQSREPRTNSEPQFAYDERHPFVFAVDRLRMNSEDGPTGRPNYSVLSGNSGVSKDDQWPAQKERTFDSSGGGSATKTSASLSSAEFLHRLAYFLVRDLHPPEVLEDDGFKVSGLKNLAESLAHCFQQLHGSVQIQSSAGFGGPWPLHVVTNRPALVSDLLQQSQLFPPVSSRYVTIPCFFTTLISSLEAALNLSEVKSVLHLIYDEYRAQGNRNKIVKSSGQMMNNLHFVSIKTLVGESEHNTANVQIPECFAGENERNNNRHGKPERTEHDDEKLDSGENNLNHCLLSSLPWGDSIRFDFALDLLKWAAQACYNDGDMKISLYMGTFGELLKILQDVKRIIDLLSKGETFSSIAMIEPTLLRLFDSSLKNPGTDQTRGNTPSDVPERHVVISSFKLAVKAYLTQVYPREGPVHDALLVASLLDPRFKSNIYQSQKDAYRILQAKVDQVHISPETPTESTEQQKKSLDQLLRNSVPCENPSSEIDRYVCLDEIGPSENPIQWWIRHRNNFPHLAILAFYYLIIPPNSCEVHPSDCDSRVQGSPSTESRISGMSLSADWVKENLVSVNFSSGSGARIQPADLPTYYFLMKNWRYTAAR
ncbi:unnamed protein product [Calicophoron daubneyi]|uniref:BED-type domain-containing protein n=1 Tax=Calicophoron daubneyi TaxID=300641 RepID=A0AAV2TR83_CALDB